MRIKKSVGTRDWKHAYSVFQSCTILFKFILTNLSSVVVNRRWTRAVVFETLGFLENRIYNVGYSVGNVICHL